MHGQTIMDVREFFNQNPSISSSSAVLKFVFFRVSLEDSWLCSPRCLFRVLQILFFMLFIYSAFPLFFLFPYFTPKWFSLFSMQLFICFCAMSINLLVDFSFVILEIPLLFVLLDPIRHLLSLLSIYYCFSTCIFRLIYRSYFGIFFILLGSFAFYLPLQCCHFIFCFIFLHFEVACLFDVLSSFPFQVLYFCSNSFRGCQFYH